MKTITRNFRQVICPMCGKDDSVSIETFDEMLKIPWINYLQGAPIRIPLRCPYCGHRFNMDFIFSE
jgi:C4-type Zn-finger protein